MDRLDKELGRLHSANFDECISIVDRYLDELKVTKSLVEADKSESQAHLKRLLQNSQKTQAQLTAAEKSVYSSISKFNKALTRSFEGYETSDDRKPLLCPPGSNDKIQQAILMHLIRIGEFESASTLMEETNQQVPKEAMASFEKLYHILDVLKDGDLQAAIEWAAENRTQLNERGSNLEFLLHKQQFLQYLVEQRDKMKALQYAIDNIAPYGARYFQEICHLAGSLLFAGDDLEWGPCQELFATVNKKDELQELFKSEYCALLNTPPDSPLCIAVLAGTLSLPVMVKMQRVMQIRGAEWTTKEELPVEIDLPESLQYHNVFVCPVSKEQTTDQNPPMMLKCGHIISKETLEVLEGNHDGHAFKCPYCPKESTYYDSVRVFF